MKFLYSVRWKCPRNKLKLVIPNTLAKKSYQGLKNSTKEKVRSARKSEKKVCTKGLIFRSIHNEQRKIPLVCQRNFEKMFNRTLRRHRGSNFVLSCVFSPFFLFLTLLIESGKGSGFRNVISFWWQPINGSERKTSLISLLRIGFDFGSSSNFLSLFAFFRDPITWTSLVNGGKWDWWKHNQIFFLEIKKKLV